jgi:hypothetical protein
MLYLPALLRQLLLHLDKDIAIAGYRIFLHSIDLHEYLLFLERLWQRMQQRTSRVTPGLSLELPEVLLVLLLDMEPVRRW